MVALYRLAGSSVTKVKTIRGQQPFFVGVSFLTDNRTLLVGMGANFMNVRLYRVDVDTSKIDPVAADVPQSFSPVVSRQGDKVLFTRQNYDENLYSLSLSRPGAAEKVRPLRSPHLLLETQIRISRLTVTEWLSAPI